MNILKFIACFLILTHYSFGQNGNTFYFGSNYKPSDLIYNQIPTGVRLVKNEEDWLKLSPYEPCCCYPLFQEIYNGYGLLYNYLAFKLITNKLNISKQGITVCTESDWNYIPVIKKQELEVAQICFRTDLEQCFIHQLDGIFNIILVNHFNCCMHVAQWDRYQY